MVPPVSRFHASRRRSRSPLGVSGRPLRGIHDNGSLRHLRENNLYSEYRPKFREEPLSNGARRDFGPRRYVRSMGWKTIPEDHPRSSMLRRNGFIDTGQVANFGRGYYEERSRGRESVVERERRYDLRGDYQQYRNERQQPYDEMPSHGGRQGGRSFDRDAWRSDRVPPHRNAPVVVSPHPRQKPRYNITAPQRYERPSASFGARAVRSLDGGGRGPTHPTYRTGRGSVRRPAFRTGPVQRPPPPRR
ncbi:hypothetical protein TcWFU_001283 [Taenia crassiceps]|uniref:Uncharacterized protein n=1 Tax=Taenia crassiceps TaxID=6207 RepID=A0ABR4Q616_9CEST